MKKQLCPRQTTTRRGLDLNRDGENGDIPSAPAGEEQPLGPVSPSPSPIHQDYGTTDTEDLYQSSDDWQRPSVDQCQRSELSQQILEANKDADGTLDLVCRVTDILTTTVVFTVLLFVALAVPVVMITMGVKYLDDCPMQRHLPVYLLVGGCFLALKLLGMLWRNLQLRRYDSMDAFYDSPDGELAFPSRTFRVMDWLLAAFLLAWHVAGACWVISIWQPPYQPSLHEPSHYCGSAVYLCALVEISAAGGLFVLTVLGWLGLALAYKYTNVFEQ